MFKVNNKDIRTRFLVYLMLTMTIFAHFSSISIVDVEQVNTCWIAVEFE